ncbi:MAG: hypothetical protein HKN88_00220 [Gammaproteobacteria bacterium]|nr:hypothetical protein [Gammaproteobacteria bacterium]
MEGKVSKSRVRSPSYPSKSIAQAIEMISAFYNAEKRNSARLPIALTHWGFSKSSGSGLKALAAFSSYGLIDVKGSGKNKSVSISELGLRIVLDNRENSTERKDAIRTAALNPKIHKRLWSRWGSDLPSDENMRHILIFDDKFNEKFVDRFIKQYKSTLKHAGLLESGLSDSVPDDEFVESFANDDFSEEDEGQTNLSADSEISISSDSTNEPIRHVSTSDKEIAMFPVGKDLQVKLFANAGVNRKSMEALVKQITLAIEIGVFDSTE